jgi:hypothetical protein
MNGGQKIPSKKLNMISGLDNILGRDMISSISATATNITFSGINPVTNPDNLKKIFNHNKINRDWQNILRIDATDRTQPSSLKFVINFNADVNDFFMIKSFGVMFGINADKFSQGYSVTHTITTLTRNGNIAQFVPFGGQNTDPNFINTQRLFIENSNLSYYQDPVVKLTYHIDIPANTFTRLIPITYMYANAVDMYGSSSSFPYIGGDTFTGDISFQTGSTVKIGAVTSLPTANSTHRGKILRVEGASGVEDGAYICSKRSDNIYTWKPIGTDANSTSNRPISGLYIGRSYFDTTLGKPIWLKQIAPPIWVDSTGTTV